MNEHDPQRFVEQVAAAACMELFNRYGVAITPGSDDDDPVSPEFLLCSVIGFSGRDIRGTLVLALTEELPGLSNPVASALPEEVKNALMQRDWVGEFSNQLLGRVKLELLRCGVEIYINLPAVLRGQHLARLPRAQLKPMKFTLGGGVVAVWLEMEARPGFQIGTATSDGQTPPSAGDALMFD